MKSGVMRPPVLAIAAAVLAVLGPGCADDGPSAQPAPVAIDFSDGRSRPLEIRAEGVERREGLRVERLTYAAVDGDRVPALFAHPPASTPTRGCLIFQYGLRSSKATSSAIWPGAAKLGLATFSIDLRYHGDRAKASSLEVARRSPNKLFNLVRQSVQDLRRAVTLLSDRPECHERIAYAGISLGGIVGAPLGAVEKRLDAVVLASTPPSWEALLEASDQVLPTVEDDETALSEALDRLDPLDPDRFVPQIAPRPVLLLNGDQDPLVPLADARVLQASAREPKETLIYPGAHDPLAAPWGKDNGDAIAAFLRERLGLKAP